MRKSSVFDLLLALVLLTTFVGCSVYMVMLGANAYRNMVDEAKYIDNERIAFAFVENQLKMANSLDSVSLEEIDGINCIVIDNEKSNHYIYVNDGYLSELVAKKDAKLILDGGERIVECDGLSLSEDDGQLLVSLEINDQVKTKHVVLR